MHLIRRQFPMALPTDILRLQLAFWIVFGIRHGVDLDLGFGFDFSFVFAFVFGFGKCMTLAAQPKNEIRPRHGGRSQRRPERQQQICAAAVPGQPQSIARQKLGPASEKYGFSFKPGHAAQKGDRAVAEAYAAAAKMKTKTKSKSAICKGIKHFDQAINRPRSTARFTARSWWGWQTICLYGFYCFPTRKDQNKKKRNIATKFTINNNKNPKRGIKRCATPVTQIKMKLQMDRQKLKPLSGALGQVLTANRNIIYEDGA